jgi:hypothetical protein
MTGESAMAELQSKTPGPIVRYGLVAYLIGSFLWRVLTPAHEYPGRFATYLEIAVDTLVMVGLIGIRAKVPKPLFWVALVAGVAMFLIRLNSDASWWTGHLVYTLPPR